MRQGLSGSKCLLGSKEYGGKGMTSKIEWLRSTDGRPGYTINPVKGLCPVACSDNQGKEYCYARRMYKRFKWNPEILYDALWWDIIEHIKKPARIFIGSTMELFGDWVKWEWQRYIIQKCESYPQHTFIFLTKQPQNLAKFSPFPENCWVGVSATDYKMFAYGLEALAGISAKVKFISIEPMLERLNIPIQEEVLKNCGISWIIIGAQTPYSPKTAPKLSWVKEIVESADKAGISVFEKNSLIPLLGTNLRQEFPSRSQDLSQMQKPLLG